MQKLHKRFSVSGKTHASASLAWILQACLHFEHIKKIGLGYDFRFYEMVEVIEYYRMKKKSNEVEKQRDGRLYLILMLLWYCYRK